MLQKKKGWGGMLKYIKNYLQITEKEKHPSKNKGKIFKWNIAQLECQHIADENIKW